MREQRSIFDGIDWVMVILFLLLVFMGWLNIYAAVFNEEHQSIFDTTQRYGKQMIFIGFSVFVALVILLIDGKFYSTFSVPIYIANMLLLIVVLITAKEVAGARSWIDIGPLKLQPAEFAKSATALALAAFLSDINTRMKDLQTKVIAGIILGIPAALILLQNDTGSMLVFGAFALVLYREGLSGNILLLGLAFAVLFIFSLLFTPLTMLIILGSIGLVAFLFQRKKTWKLGLGIGGIIVVLMGFVYSVDYLFNNVLEPHQQVRINVLLGKEDDPKGAGYNVNQSKIAIGSGGFTGKGFLKGTQTKYDFVPEQTTDFIFCTVGEEWGFLGTFVVIALFTALILRILYISERQRSSFTRIYGYCVASIFLFHFIINIGMTIGLMPVIGIPLPFFSYGGSSLLGFTILLFIFIKLDGYRLQQLR
ncbi:MAG: rod shape-determining protein RodA [Flavobacteriales bacterium]|nr:rod shape-determining protein RodA [Flavobacteriales bacterium]